MQQVHNDEQQIIQICHLTFAYVCFPYLFSNVINTWHIDASLITSTLKAIAWYFSFQSCHLISLSSCLSAEDTIQCPIITSSLHLPTGLLLSLWQLARTVLEWPVCPWDVAARDLLIGVWHQVFVWDIPLLFQTLMSSLINYILHATVTQSSKKKEQQQNASICL